MKRQPELWDITDMFSIPKLTRSKICLRCSRRLTDPESIRKGVGPVCYKVFFGNIVSGSLNPDLRVK